MKTLSTHYSILELAEALEVSSSGYHAHGHKALGQRRQEDAKLRPLITQSFKQSRRTYGSPRILDDLRDRGVRCGKNRVARLMREDGHRARQKRRFRPQTTNSKHAFPAAPNWLAKVPKADRPAQIWQSDLTYIPTTEGWLYLAFTLDACSRKVVSYSFRDDLGAELCVATLNKAIHQQPLARGIIHHSDRGVQYACTAFRTLLDDYSITSSMSRPGNPYDNALAESFVATLKTECLPDQPDTKNQTKLMVFEYIESFYNPRRKHSSLGNRSPIQFEALFPLN